MELKKRVLNGRYSALIISILVHVLLLTGLVSTTVSLPENTKPAEIKAIKSYLYKAPKTITKKIVSISAVNAASIVPTKETKPVVKKTSQLQAIVSKQVNENVSDTIKHIQITPVAKVTFSAHKQLSQLKNKLNKQIMKQSFNTQQQRRNASVSTAMKLNVAQIIVPHSAVQLTSAQKKREKYYSNV